MPSRFRRKLSSDARDVDGTPSGVGDRGRDREIATPRIVTARPDLTATADLGRSPERLEPYLKEHQQQGAALVIQSMDTQSGFLLADSSVN